MTPAGLNTADPTLTRVERLDDPRLAEYANLRDAELRARRGEAPDGIFMAEGAFVVGQLLDSPCRVRSVLITERRLAAMSAELARLPAGVPVYVVEQDVMNEVVGFNIHRGVLAAGYRPDPAPPAQVVSNARAVVVMEDLANHDNVGGVFRNIGALVGRGGAALLSPGCCDPLYRKAIRVSMGHALRVPFARLEEWPRPLEGLGLTLIALTPRGDSTPIEEFVMPSGCKPAFLVGAEGPGVSDSVLSLAAHRVRIPIGSGADSLNVAVALGIALSRLVRPQ